MLAAQSVTLENFDSSAGKFQSFALRVPDHDGKHGSAASLLLDDFTSMVEHKLPVADGSQKPRRAIPASRRQKTLRDELPTDPMPCLAEPYVPSPQLPGQAERRRAVWYSSMVAAACEAGVPARLFDALIIQESRYNPIAISPKGATGLAQLMPASARILGVRNILDPRENMRAGARYLRGLLDEFGRFDLALAAYNAGAGRVRATGRVPRITETIHYVSSILVTMQRDRVPRRGVAYLGHRQFRHQLEPIMHRSQPRA